MNYLPIVLLGTQLRAQVIRFDLRERDQAINSSRLHLLLTLISFLPGNLRLWPSAYRFAKRPKGTDTEVPADGIASAQLTLSVIEVTIGGDFDVDFGRGRDAWEN